MSAAGTTSTTSCTWPALLPADRDYVVLPSRAHPVLAADRDAAVLAYVRRSLLARPPGSRLPGWAYESARQLLRSRVVWRAAPTWRPPSQHRSGVEAGFAKWIEASGHRVVVLDHSHDPDSRAVLLLFGPHAPAPTIAVKVATTSSAAARLDGERSRLGELQNAPLEALGDSIPRLVDLPVATGSALLATTAMDGEPMFVGYYRNGHSRRPETVRRDYDAAAEWLARLQSEPTGERLRLGVPSSTCAAARCVDPVDDRDAVLTGLAALDTRLARHQVTERIVHGDFWAGNVMVRAGAVCGVVDWERWEPAGNPLRDLGRFAVGYSLYLDRQTRPGAQVRGHAGLVAGSPAGGVGYGIDGSGWYPSILRSFVAAGLARLGLPASLGRDVVLAELAELAAESTNPEFARNLWRTFAVLSGRTS